MIFWSLDLVNGRSFCTNMQIFLFWASKNYLENEITQKSCIALKFCELSFDNIFLKMFSHFGIKLRSENTTCIVWATTLTSKSRNDLRRHEGTPCVTSPQTLGKMERKCKIGKIEKNYQNLSLAVTTKILGPRITTNKWNVGLVYKVGYSTYI